MRRVRTLAAPIICTPPDLILVSPASGAEKLREHLASLLVNLMPEERVDDWLAELVRGRFDHLAIG